jgi:dTDP-4-dehydrorhamnose reductase
MKIEKVIIFGSNGMLGNYIYKYLLQNMRIVIVGILRECFDVETDSFTKLKLLFHNLSVDKNTVIINAIGLIPQKQYDVTNNARYYKVNTVFPMLLSQLSEQYGNKLVHPSTDCVYTGLCGNYKETDPHDAITHYGISKSLGENIGPNGTIIRTSIIGETKSGVSLVEWVKNNKNSTINGYINHYWNGITCLEYAKLIKWMIETDTFWTGVKHIYSPTVYSKYDLVRIINDIYDLNINIIPNKVSYCDRSLSSIKTDQLDYVIPELSEQIKEMKAYN